MNTTPKPLTSEQGAELLRVCKARFEKNPKRHPGLDWAQVQARLEGYPDKLWSLAEMERTGGEPDVIGRDAVTGEFVFVDCSAESPKGRRSLCYDREARVSRKDAPPDGSADELAAAIGIDLLDEGQYRALQEVGRFDEKTSSWLRTPAEVRQLGGAIFGDWRYGRVFAYHNGVQSYYAARGFRGALRV